MFSWLFDQSKPGVSFVKIYACLVLSWLIIIAGFIYL